MDEIKIGKYFVYKDSLWVLHLILCDIYKKLKAGVDLDEKEKLVIELHFGLKPEEITGSKLEDYFSMLVKLQNLIKN